MKTFYVKSLFVMLFAWISMVGIATTINVPADYATIQAAINAASDGDIIQISAGTYTEALSIGKSLTLIGSGPAANPTTILTHPTSTVANLTVTNKSFTFQNLIIQGNLVNRGIYAGSGIDINSFIMQDVIGRNCKVAVYFSEKYTGGSFQSTTVNSFALTNVTLSDNIYIGAYIGKAVISGTVTGCNVYNNGYSDAEAAAWQKCGIQFIDFYGNPVPQVTVTNSTFDNNGNGLSDIERSGLVYYSATNTSIAPADIMVVSGCTFTNHPQYAVRIKNGYNAGNTATVNGTFSNNWLDIWFNNVIGTTSSTTLVRNTQTGIRTVGPGPTYSYSTIQAAIDAASPGDIIQVAAGTYTEQVLINKDNLTITGAGIGQTIIKSPATLAASFGTPGIKKAVVCAHTINNVNLSNLTIDGDGKGNANAAFVGLAFWNAGGTVNDVNVIGVRNTPFDGAQHGVAVYAYNDTGGPYTITINGMDIYDFQKNAMALMGTGLTIDLDNIDVTGAGPTSVTAQNGIQIGYGANGTADNCTIDGIVWVGPTWTASGILLLNGGTVDFTGCTVNNAQTSVYCQDANGSFDDGSITNPVGTGILIYSYAAKGDNGDIKLKPQPIEEDYSGDPKSAVIFNVDHSTLTGNMVTDEYGIEAYAMSGPITMDITYCDINYWDYGILAYEAGGTVDVEAHFCDLSNNNVGFYTNATAKALQDATQSYWGHATGPYHPTLNPGGLGVDVSDGVIFEPWLTNPEGDDVIDIGLYNTTCADFEVRLKPSYDLNATALTNIQFTVKWPESSGVSIINAMSTTFGIAQQGPTIVDGGFYYAVFVGVPMSTITWTAGIEYVVMTFSHNELGTGSADFVIAEDAWAVANNGVYYVEQVGMDVTGGVYHNATGVFLGSCDLQLKVFLAGPYNPVSNMMDDQVRDAGYVSLTQPYNVAPWSYSGSENLNPIPDDVVDWVLVELRSGTDAGSIVERKAGFLKTDGSVVKHDDMAHGLRFENVISGELYYIVVWHRNHMPVMTAEGIALPNLTLLDLTTDAPLKVYGYPGKIASMEMETGVYGLIAGDVNANGELKYSGPNNDRGYIISRIVACNGGSPNLNNSCTNGYWMEDVNINNVVLYSGANNDRDEMLQNFTYVNGVPYLHYVYQSAVPGALTGMKDAKTKEIFDIMLRNKGDRFEVVVMAKEDIYKGLIDNIQFSLAWNSWDTEMSAMVASQLNYYGISAQGPAAIDNYKNYQVFVGVNPIYLPEFMKAGDELMVMSIIKKNEAYAEHFLEINNDEFSMKQNGEFFISVWGEDVTGMVTDGPLGLENASAQNLCRVFPNPVTDGRFTVEIFSSVSDLFNVEVLSLEGKVLQAASFQVQAGERLTQTISTNGLTKGNYLVRVVSNYQNFTERVLVK